MVTNAQTTCEILILSLNNPDFFSIRLNVFYFDAPFFCEERHCILHLESRGYGSPSKYQHVPEFKKLPTSGKEAVGKISQPAKAWQKPVKRQQMAPRGIKPTPQHLIGGRNASPSKPTSKSHRPPTRLLGQTVVQDWADNLQRNKRSSF